MCLIAYCLPIVLPIVLLIVLRIAYCIAPYWCHCPLLPIAVSDLVLSDLVCGYLHQVAGPGPGRRGSCLAWFGLLFMIKS